MAAIIAAVATYLGTLVPSLGAPVFAVLVGFFASSGARRRPEFGPGVSFAKGRLLQVAVVLLGVQLSLREVLDVGWQSLPVLVSTLVVCLVLAQVVGGRLGIDADLRTLIGVGTGICGASAIATVSPVIKAKSADVAYAISTIFLFNVAAVVVFPAIGHALGMSQHDFGLFAGTAVNDTSSVVAAATAFGTAAAGYAVVVKLTRTLAIVPITLYLGLRHGDTELRGAWRLVPWFLTGFVVVVLLNTAGVIPDALTSPVHHLDAFLVATALAAIGISTDVPALRRAGAKPLLLGLILWAAVTVTSLLVGAVAA